MTDVSLFQLLIELGWRIDTGRAATAYELFTVDGELTVDKFHPVGREAVRA